MRFPTPTTPAGRRGPAALAAVALLLALGPDPGAGATAPPGAESYGHPTPSTAPHAYAPTGTVVGLPGSCRTTLHGPQWYHGWKGAGAWRHRCLRHRPGVAWWYPYPAYVFHPYPAPLVRTGTRIHVSIAFGTGPFVGWHWSPWTPVVYKPWTPVIYRPWVPVGYAVHPGIHRWSHRPPAPARTAVPRATPGADRPGVGYKEPERAAREGRDAVVRSGSGVIPGASSTSSTATSDGARRGSAAGSGGETSPPTTSRESRTGGGTSAIPATGTRRAPAERAASGSREATAGPPAPGAREDRLRVRRSAPAPEGESGRVRGAGQRDGSGLQGLIRRITPPSSAAGTRSPSVRSGDRPATRSAPAPSTRGRSAPPAATRDSRSSGSRSSSDSRRRSRGGGR